MEVSGQPHGPAALPSREEPLGADRIGVLLDPSVCLGVLENKNLITKCLKL